MDKQKTWLALSELEDKNILIETKIKTLDFICSMYQSYFDFDCTRADEIWGAYCVEHKEDMTLFSWFLQNELREIKTLIELQGIEIANEMKRRNKEK